MLATCYNVTMLSKLKNKYETYKPGEFLPIYCDGELANKKEFHRYKLKQLFYAIDSAWVGVLNRAYNK